MPSALKTAEPPLAAEKHRGAVSGLWNALLAATLALSCLIVLVPALFLAVTSVRDQSGGSLTLANYISAFGHPRHVTAIINTIALGGAASFISLALALPLAWAVSRSDMPLQGLVYFGVIAGFVLPPYLGALGWILLAGPNAGLLNRLWIAATGSQSGLLNVFSFWGLAVVTAFHCFTYIFVFVSSALAAIPSDLEDAAKLAGARPLRIAFAITLPAAAPAILASLAVTFLEAITLFGTPALIGIPAGLTVAATQMWQFFEYPIETGTAAAFSMSLLIPAAASALLQRRLLGGRKYAVFEGRGWRGQRTELGRWRWPFFGYCSLVTALAAGLPSLVLLQCSLSKAWGRGVTLDNLTLNNFRYVLFEESGLAQAVLHSTVYSALAASVALFCGFIGASWLLVNKSGLGRFGRLLFTLPLGLPGIITGIAVYATFGPAPFYLHGTAAILILALAIRPIGVAFASSAFALSAVSPELEDAARLAGASKVQSLRLVTAPLVSEALIGIWLLNFIAALRELSTVIFLTGPNTRLISTTLMDLAESGKFEAVAALGLILIILCAAAAVLGRRYLTGGFLHR